MLCSFCEILRIYYPLLLRGRVEDAEEKSMLSRRLQKPDCFVIRRDVVGSILPHQGDRMLERPVRLYNIFIYVFDLYYILHFSEILYYKFVILYKIIEFPLVAISKHLAYLEQIYISIQSLEGCCILVFFQ